MWQKKKIEGKASEQPMIRIIRRKQVMLDRDLETIYGVETKRLNEQVKRNIERFPDDFMFQLTKEEFEEWKSQFATSKSITMGVRELPYEFTENGVAMLSSVLRSQTDIEANIRLSRLSDSTRHITGLSFLVFTILIIHQLTQDDGEFGTFVRL